MRTSSWCMGGAYWLGIDMQKFFVNCATQFETERIFTSLTNPWAAIHGEYYTKNASCIIIFRNATIVTSVRAGLPINMNGSISALMWKSSNGVPDGIRIRECGKEGNI